MGSNISNPKNPTGNDKFIIIAGPCAIEDDKITIKTATALREIVEGFGFIFIFKSSYDKANRTSISSFRGPGAEKGITLLQEVRKSLNVSVTTDFHTVEEIERWGKKVDLIQIPALLSRQTDLLIAAAKTGVPINIKKGQFMSPYDMKYVVEKVLANSNSKVFLTERGTTFGYNNLVVDFRSFPIMKSFGYPVIFDATHSVQLPGGGAHSGGQKEFVRYLAKAAVTTGIDGLFFEVHPNPNRAKCDGANMLNLEEFKKLLKEIKEILDATKNQPK